MSKNGKNIVFLSLFSKIINNGDYIKEYEYDKIFERFYRADKSRNRQNNR